MKELETVAREVIGWLHQQHHAYALIGGLAVSFRAIERLTKDVDLAVVVENDQHAENVVRELCSLGYDIQTLLEQTKHGRIATVRLIKRDQGIVFVDLLFSSSGIEPEIAEEAEPIQIFPELSVMAASNWQWFGVWNDFHVPAIIRFMRLINELVDVAVSFGLSKRFSDLGFVETGASSCLCRVDTNIDNVLESIILRRSHV